MCAVEYYKRCLFCQLLCMSGITHTCLSQLHFASTTPTSRRMNSDGTTKEVIAKVFHDNMKGMFTRRGTKELACVSV